jgi:hypothetical protein
VKLEAIVRSRILSCLIHPLLGVTIPYKWYQTRLAQFGPLALPPLSRRYLEWLGWIPLGLRTLMALTFPITKLE